MVGWEMCFVDYVGLLKGLLSTWNPFKANFIPYLSATRILLEGVSKDLNKILKVANYYGPYADKKGFWEEVLEDGILRESNLILGGDLNFTRSTREVWGQSIRLDPLAYFFIRCFKRMV